MTPLEHLVTTVIPRAVGRAQETANRATNVILTPERLLAYNAGLHDGAVAMVSELAERGLLDEAALTAEADRA